MIMEIKKYSRKSLSFFLCVLLTLLSVSYVSYIYAFRKGREEGKAVGLIEAAKKKLMDEKIILPPDLGDSLPLAVQHLIEELNPFSIAESISSCSNCNDIDDCREQFSKELDQVNRALILELAHQYNTSEEDLAKVMKKFDLLLPILVENEFKEFVKYNCREVKSSLNFSHSTRELEVAGLESEISYKTVSRFSIALHNIICETSDLFIEGLPCADLTKSVSTPISEEMMEKAYMTDVNRSIRKIESRFRAREFNIGTVSESVYIDCSQKKLSWIPFSWAELDVRFKGKVTAGIDLMKGVSLLHNHSSQTVYVELPPAEILSVEVDFDQVDSSPGFWTKMDPEVMKMLHDSIKVSIKKLAIEDAILMEAEENVKSFLEMTIQPMLQHSHGDYQLKIIKRARGLVLPAEAA